jgi:hypothetical protein
MTQSAVSTYSAKEANDKYNKNIKNTKMMAKFKSKKK